MKKLYGTQALIAAWCIEFSSCEENLFIRELRAKGLSDEQILVVLKQLDATCLYCFNGDKNCFCTRYQ